jgi:hypothetical protein
MGLSMYPLSFLGKKKSVKTFLLQRKIIGGVFYTVRVVSNESRRLVLLTSSGVFFVYYVNGGTAEGILERDTQRTEAAHVRYLLILLEITRLQQKIHSCIKLK